ncbi:MAG: helix-turn-helix transcriptional regulator [Treponema sp.]|nr:helix-turn-helix transcriptional regulator [Treponema sp.]
MPDYDYGINERVIHIRKALGLLQREFADGIRVSRSCQGGIEAKHRKVSDRLIKMICLTYKVSETWLRTGQGTMFDAEKDPRLERIIRNFNRMDSLLQDYVMKYLDWLVEYYENRPGEGPGAGFTGI